MLEPRLIENEPQSTQLRRAEGTISVHQLRARIQVWPDAHAAEPGGMQEVKVRRDVGCAHRAEVRHEQQEGRRPVNREAITLYRQLLRVRPHRAQQQRNQQDDSDETYWRATAFCC